MVSYDKLITQSYQKLIVFYEKWLDLNKNQGQSSSNTKFFLNYINTSLKNTAQFNLITDLNSA